MKNRSMKNKNYLFLVTAFLKPSGSGISQLGSAYLENIYIFTKYFKIDTFTFRLSIPLPTNKIYLIKEFRRLLLYIKKAFIFPSQK